MNAWSLATSNWNFNLNHQRSGGTFARNMKTARHSVQWAKAKPSCNEEIHKCVRIPTTKKMSFLFSISMIQRNATTVWTQIKVKTDGKINLIFANRLFQKLAIKTLSCKSSTSKGRKEASIHLSWPPIVETWPVDILLGPSAMAWCNQVFSWK